MARKKNKTKQYSAPTFDSTVRRLNSLLIHPDTKQFLLQGNTKGVREKLVKINFTTLRAITEKVPLAQAIINTRIDQILPFTQPIEGRDQKGFEIVKVGAGRANVVNPGEEEEIRVLTDFMYRTGYYDDPDREDDFSDYLQMFVRDTLIIDQVATELQFNKLDQAVAFWALDPATIKRTTPANPWGPRVRYVQEIDQKVWNIFSQDNLVFDYKNKRSDLMYRGYGYSPIEQAVDIVTTLLFGYQYARDQYIRDRVPKGFLSVMGDVGQRELDALQRYWYAAMSGAGGQWNIPILPSGKDGVGLDFKVIGQSNKDMEYHKMMLFISSVVAAVFAIDLSEMGMKSDDSASMFGDRVESRISASKGRGLSSLLMYIQQHLNKVIYKFTNKYRIKFVGYDTEDEIMRIDLANKRIATNRSINETREEDGLEPVEHDYANHILNPVAIQHHHNNKDREFQQEVQEDNMEMAEKQLAVDKMKAKKPTGSS